jgi:hypothetical protein
VTQKTSAQATDIGYAHHFKKHNMQETWVAWI